MHELKRSLMAWLAVLVLPMASVRAQETAPVAAEAPLAAYIVEPLSWTSHWDEPCAAEEGCRGEPDHRQMRYRWVETLRGPVRTGELVLKLTSEVDRDSTLTKRTLLLGRWRPDGAFAPILALPVDALRGGGWGHCSDFVYLSEFEDEDEPARHPLEFVDAFGDASRYTPRGRREQFDPGHYEIVGNDVRCKGGVRTGDVVELYAGEPVATAGPEPEAMNPHDDADPDSERAQAKRRRRERDDAARAKSDSMSIVMANPYGEVLWPFVGEQVSMRNTEAQCGAGCWQFDSVYSARYRPRQVFDNAEIGTSPVTFSVYTHYGFPDFARTPAALVFVWARTDGLQLAKYRAMSVDRTTDGRWAVCGDPYDPETDPPVDEPRTVPLRFGDDVVFDDVSRWSAPRIAETYPADGYEIVDGKVHCTRGAYAEDVARQVGAQIRREAEKERAGEE